MTHRPCLSAEEIANAIRGFRTDDSQRHVSECEACTRRVALLRRVREAGLAPIADVTSEVDALIAKLLAAPRSTWWKVVLEPEYRRTDVARRLLSMGVDARLRDRHLAVDFTRAATRIVDSLAPADIHEVADLRFEAWKFLSVVLRETGRYSEAEAAFLSAGAAALATSDPELAETSVLLSRALFCAEPDVWKPEEAATLLDRAERVLVARGDPVRIQAALTARAFLLFRSGNPRAACEKFTELLDATPKSDHENYLSALNNVMWVRVELHEVDSEVEQAIAFLIDTNVALGRAVPAARARWMMGRVCRIRGDYGEAVERLRAEMVTVGDSDSSIRVGLDALESLLLDERHQEAFRLARELASVAVALDLREPSRRHGLTAQVLAYLREAAQRQALTADLVSEVARYVDRIARQRPFDFIPPMPLADM
jgi:tetratricopeptide (TPR) repeat protein